MPYGSLASTEDVYEPDAADVVFDADAELAAFADELAELADFDALADPLPAQPASASAAHVSSATNVMMTPR